MSDKLEITETYEPNDKLEEYLQYLSRNTIIEYTGNDPVTLPNGMPVQRLSLKITFEGKTITGYETRYPFGIFCSLHDDPDMAAAVILALSLGYGEPTQIYEDYQNIDGHLPDYSDLTSEWYYDSYVEKGLPESRMEIRPDIYETTHVSLEDIEERAERWLSSD